MNIGLVVENLDPRRGGVEQWTCQFARWLLAHNHEVHVVAKRFAAHLPGGLVCHAVGDARSRCEFAAAAGRAIRGLRLDVIHDMGAGWHCDVFGPHGGSRRSAFERNLALAPRWQRPLKRRMSGLLPRYRDFDRLIAQQYVDDGRLFLALSRMVADDFHRYHDVPEERIRLVYNGVDTERFSPRLRDPLRDRTREALGLTDEVLLLIVAHNFRLKGVPTLERATKQLASEGANVRLAVVGGKAPHSRATAGLSSSARLSTIPTAGQASNGTRSLPAVGALVHYLGPVDDTTPYYAAADVYVHPTHYDPCSLVVLEALASGLPVVTSRYNGAGELITPGVEGHVIRDPEDHMELARCLAPLMDARRRTTMGHAARTLAERHTLAHNCQQVLEVYRQVDGAVGKAA